MTTQEFKEQHPEFAHLEGVRLWNAMEDFSLMKPLDPLPDDNEIGLTVKDDDGYTFNFTKGFLRTAKEFMKDIKPTEFSNPGWYIPSGEKKPPIKYKYFPDEPEKNKSPTTT